MIYNPRLNFRVFDVVARTFNILPANCWEIIALHHSIKHDIDGVPPVCSFRYVEVEVASIPHLLILLVPRVVLALLLFVELVEPPHSVYHLVNQAHWYTV